MMNINQRLSAYERCLGWARRLSPEARDRAWRDYRARGAAAAATLRALKAEIAQLEKERARHQRALDAYRAQLIARQ